MGGWESTGFYCRSLSESCAEWKQKGFRIFSLDSRLSAPEAWVLGEAPMKIHVFDYMDARLFLQDYFRLQKKVRSPFSYARWAEELGFANKTILTMILQGQRQITAKSLRAFQEGIGFDALEAEYFEVLVDHGQAKTSSQKQALGLRLIQVQRKNLAPKILAADSNILRSVYGPVVLTAISSAEKPIGATELAKFLGAAPGLIRGVIDDLQAAQLVVAKGAGFVASQNTFKIADAFGHQALREFYTYWIQKSVGAIDLPPEVRRFRSIQVALSPAEFAETVSRINEFAVHLVSRFEKNTITDRDLYMVNSAVFPVRI
jgi:uncharacterized protein (TIGR02147 family)